MLLEKNEDAKHKFFFLVFALVHRVSFHGQAFSLIKRSNNALFCFLNQTDWLKRKPNIVSDSFLFLKCSPFLF